MPAVNVGQRLKSELISKKGNTEGEDRRRKKREKQKEECPDFILYPLPQLLYSLTTWTLNFPILTAT